MKLLKHLMPDALAARLVFLLAIAIVLANVIALAVLAFQQESFDQKAREDREIERIAALIPAMEAVDTQLRQVIARDASTRFARVRVEDAPLLTETASDSRSRFIALELVQTLKREDISVAIINRPQPPAASPAPDKASTSQVIAITMPLTKKWPDRVAQCGDKRCIAADQTWRQQAFSDRPVAVASVRTRGCRGSCPAPDQAAQSALGGSPGRRSRRPDRPGP